MLKAVVDVGVPALVVFAMLVVGTGLTSADFRRVARRPALVLAATLGQCVLLPTIGRFLVRGLELRPTIAQGVLLVAACPGGAMANVYAHLARANVALSVTLTAVSGLTAGLTTPLALAVLQTQTGETTGFTVPPGVLAVQLLFLLVLPLLGGMALRGRWPGVCERYGRFLLRLSVAVLLTLLGFVIAQEAEQFASSLTGIAAAATLLTILAFGAGWATGLIAGAEAGDRFTVGMVFVVRNVGIATAVAVTVLGRVEFAVFATAYFLAQVPILLAAAVAFRSTRAGVGNNLPGVAHPGVPTPAEPTG
jgi:BASS family bile acid:Na+ symporter